MENKDDFKRARNENRKKSHDVVAGLDYCLEVFGDQLAEKQGYRDLDGIEALRYYLLLKHGWLPAQVRALSTDDLRFALHLELQGWNLPADARL